MNSSPTDIEHPLFARAYVRIAAAAAAERRGGADHRRELLEGLSGRVIEVGAGHGLNFAHYPTAVEHVVAVEPEPHLRAQAEVAARNAPVLVAVIAGVGDSLPFDDVHFDAGIVSLVLCSVPEQADALAELFRVIRPAGELRFYEHVRADSRPLALAQRAFDVVWPHVAGGCHTSRDTLGAIDAAGFVIEAYRRFTFQAAPTSSASPAGHEHRGLLPGITERARDLVAGRHEASGRESS